MVISNASEIDEDCSDISDWDDLDKGTGVSEQVTNPLGGGLTTFKFDSNSSAANNDYPKRQIDVGSIEGMGNTIVVSMKLYCDAIGTRANNDDFQIIIYRSDWAISVLFSSNGLHIYDGASFNEIGTNLVVQDTWQEWTFVIDLSDGVANAVVDTYLDNDLKSEGDDCSYTGSFTDGVIYLRLLGYTTNDRIAYLDWLKVGDGFVGTNLQINIGDVWKACPLAKINIGDTWKAVEGMQINIGDTWKTIF